MRRSIMGSLLLLAVTGSATARTTPPNGYARSMADRAAIQALLDAYTKAVSSRDEAAFTALLVGTDISFSGADSAVSAAHRPNGLRNFEAFRRGVFGGRGLTQNFRDVSIVQDGALADVTLTFVNHAEGKDGWGFKTLQLMKLPEGWRIASEFFTYHAGKPPVRSAK